MMALGWVPSIRWWLLPVIPLAADNCPRIDSVFDGGDSTPFFLSFTKKHKLDGS